MDDWPSCVYGTLTKAWVTLYADGSPRRLCSHLRHGRLPSRTGSWTEDRMRNTHFRNCKERIVRACSRRGKGERWQQRRHGPAYAVLTPDWCLHCKHRKAEGETDEQQK